MNPSSSEVLNEVSIFGDSVTISKRKAVICLQLGWQRGNLRPFYQGWGFFIVFGRVILKEEELCWTLSI